MYYSPGPNHHPGQGDYRQLTGTNLREDDGVLRTLDARPLPTLSIKDAHWLELNLLLTNPVPSNTLYAIRHLDLMSASPGSSESWLHTPDFPRDSVLNALRPLLSHTNEEVAVRTLMAFRVGPECVARIAPYAADLIHIANKEPSAARRVGAIAAFSGTKLRIARQQLPAWLSDASADVRAQAVLLLGDFFDEFSETALERSATDSSPRVRAAVAHAIGNGRFVRLLPTLVKLLPDQSEMAQSLLPSRTSGLQDMEEASLAEDVHTSAANALLEFDVSQVGDILRTNLDDPAFRPRYLCKLAEKNAGPWLGELAEVLTNAPGTLSGATFQCWNILYNYLRGLPASELRSGRLDPYLNLLQNAGNTGPREPLMLYELYRSKGLEERAAKFRAVLEKTFAPYGIKEQLDRIDASYAKSPQLPTSEALPSTH